jgi:SpoVK/Ycf46/Vps4 family AAA+-type ATPase
LTAEAIAERLQRPLYSVGEYRHSVLDQRLISQISAGELSLDARELEAQLSRIVQTATHWKAILLLDEADVFLQTRSTLQLERNRLVAIFLRKLEYYQGVFFFTTNLVNDFDPAILDRIHLRLQYNNLDKEARKKILRQFLMTLEATVEDKWLDRFGETCLNGRQVREANDRRGGYCN